MTDQHTTTDEHQVVVEIVGSPSVTTETAESQEESAEEYLDHLQRVQAEFTNYKKRIEREMGDLAGFAKGELVRRLFPVIDNMRRASENMSGSNGSLSEAVAMIYRELADILQDEGLECVASEGEPFDPEVHEAVLAEEAGDTHRGRVLEELEAGYMFRGRLLRPSKVKVGV